MDNIISVGCSYALDLLQFKKFNGHRFSLDGASIETIYEMVKYLVETGKYDACTWIIGVTQIGRLNRPIPYELEWRSLTLIQPKTVFFDTYKWCFFYEGLEEKQSLNFPIEWWEQEHRLHFSKSLENHIKQYLDTIIEIQKLLKGKNFIMFLMNNTFDGWFYESDNKLSHRYTNYEGTGIPSFENTFTLKTIFPDEWNTIDFSKFTFYKTKESEFGGLDEFAIENYNKTYFSTYKNDINLFGQHPNHTVQLNFFNKIIKEKL